MTLELIKNGNKEIYTTFFISGMMFRNALQIQRKLENNKFTVELLDELIGFVCNVFNNQFTVNEFYEGIDRKDIFKISNDILAKVISGDYDTH